MEKTNFTTINPPERENIHIEFTWKSYYRITSMSRLDLKKLVIEMFRIKNQKGAVVKFTAHVPQIKYEKRIPVTASWFEDSVIIINQDENNGIIAEINITQENYRH
jgi:hypothetical protein